MSLKSELVVDQVKPIGGQFDVRGKLTILRPDGTQPVFELDPDKGTISNNDFVLGHNDLEIPVFTFKDKNGLSIMTDLTTETLSGKLNPNKGIKFHTTRTPDVFGNVRNDVVLGNIADGLGSIRITSEDRSNFKEQKSSIIIDAETTAVRDSSGSLVFVVRDSILDPIVNKEGEAKYQKIPASNIYIGKPIYKNVNTYTGSFTKFMGSGSRTIIRNNLETFGLTRLRGNVKIGMGSVDHNDILANQTFTHFTHYFSPTVPAGETSTLNVYLSNTQTAQDNFSFLVTRYSELANELGIEGGVQTQDDLNEVNAALFDQYGELVGPSFYTTDDTNALNVNGEVYVLDTITDPASSNTDTVGTVNQELDNNQLGQLTIQAGKPEGSAADWVSMIGDGDFGTDLQDDHSLTPFQAASSTQPNFVTADNVGRDNQPFLKSAGSFTILIDPNNTAGTNTDRFFEVIAGISDIGSFESQRSLLTITPHDQRTAVQHLSSSGDLFANLNNISTDGTAVEAQVVIDTNTGKFFTKEVLEEVSTTFLELSDTPTTTHNEGGGLTPTTNVDYTNITPGTAEQGFNPQIESFAGNILVVNEAATALEFAETLPTASHALTASYIDAANIEGQVGFPFSGSAQITGSLAITGSSQGGLFISTPSANQIGVYATSSWASQSVSASTSLTASYISASNIAGTASWAYSASHAITASYIDAANIEGEVGFPFTGSAQILGSLEITGSGLYVSTSPNTVGVYATASHAESASTAVLAKTAISGGSVDTEFHVVNNAYIVGDLNVSGALGVADSITLSDATIEASSNAFIFGANGQSTLNHQITGNLYLTGSVGITVDSPTNQPVFIGTASWATQSVSASYALTASYIDAGDIEGTVNPFPFIGNADITGSLAITGSGLFVTTSPNTIGVYATSSWASQSISASHALTASYIDAGDIEGTVNPFPFSGSGEITGSLSITGSDANGGLIVTTPLPNNVGVYATASWAMSASNAFSSSQAATASYIAAANIDGDPSFPFIGNADITGSLRITGSGLYVSTSPNTVGVYATSSWASQSVSASTALTASYIAAENIDGQVSFPFIGNADITGSLRITGSGLYVSTSPNTIGVYATSSWASQSVSASTALTASYILGTNIDGVANAFPFSGSAEITGSLRITGSGLFVSTSQINTIGVYATSSWASQSVSASTSLTASLAMALDQAAIDNLSTTTFVGLSDTPANYTSNPYANVAVGAGNSLVFTTGHTGSFSGSQGLTGSLMGTASWAGSASNAMSSSQAATASYIAATNIDGQVGFPFTGSAQISGSLEITGSGLYISTSPNTIGVYATSSWASQSLSASIVTNYPSTGTASHAVSASYLKSFKDIDDTPDSYAGQGNYALVISGNLNELTFVQTVPSASHALTASYIDASDIEGVVNPFPFSGSGDITGSLSITGSSQGGLFISTPSANQIGVYATSSWASQSVSASYVSADNIDGQVGFPFTGSAQISGSLEITGSGLYVSTSPNTVGVYATASWAQNASNAISAKTAISGGSVDTEFHVVNNAYIVGDLNVSGALGVADSITLSDAVIEASSDAFIFGAGGQSTLNHQITGNLYLTGSVGITVDSPTNQPVFIGTASWATQSVSASHAATASYVNLDSIDGTFNPFPFTGNAEIIGSLRVTGSTSISGNLSVDGDITSFHNISSSKKITAKEIQIDNNEKIKAYNADGDTLDLAFISDINVTTFGNNTIATTILGDEDITLDSTNKIKIDSDTGEILFQDGGVTSITFDTTNGSITASAGISASIFSASNGTNVGFYGTASWATQSVSASTALTASYIDVGNIEGIINPFPFSGSAEITGSLAITGSGLYVSTSPNTVGVYATSSWASQSVSASTSLTASYILGSNVDGAVIPFPFSGSGQITGSLAITGSTQGGLFISTPSANQIGIYATSSWASQSVSASQALNATNATTATNLTSFLNILDTPSAWTNGEGANQVGYSLAISSSGNELEFVKIVNSASFASQSATASHAVTASLAMALDQSVVDSLLVNTFENLSDTDVTAPYTQNHMVYVDSNLKLNLTGSVPLATLANTASYVLAENIDGQVGFPFTGSAEITGSLAITGSGLYVSTSPNTVGVYATSSWASQSVSASYILGSNIDGAVNPFPFSGSGDITGSLSITGSTQGGLFISTPSANQIGVYATSSWATQSVSASTALTASYISASNVDGDVTFPYEGYAVITGSLELVGSASVHLPLNLTPDQGNLYVTSSITDSDGNSLGSIFNNIGGNGYGFGQTSIFSTTGDDLHIDLNAEGKLNYSPVVDRIEIDFLDFQNYYSKRIQISGSNSPTSEESSWTSLAVEPYESTNLSREFAFANIIPYKWYRFTFDYDDLNQDDTLTRKVGINEIYLYSDLGSVQANNFIGPLTGTASNAVSSSTAISSSIAATASYVHIDNVDGNVIPFPFTGNADITGSLRITGSGLYVTTSPNTVGVYATSSWATQSVSASYSVSASQAVTASYILGSNVEGVVNAFPFSGSALITGSLAITGSSQGGLFISTPSANQIGVYATSSWASQSVSASIAVSAISSSVATHSITSSTIEVHDGENKEGKYPLLFNGDVNTPNGGAEKVYSDTALNYNAFIDVLEVTNIDVTNITASHIQITGSGDITGSLRISGSGLFVSTSQINTIGVYATSSWATQSVSASTSLTASYILGSNVDGAVVAFPFSGSALITGSLAITGSSQGGLFISTPSANQIGVYATSSWASQSISSSQALTASLAMSGGSATQAFRVNNDAFISGALFVSGNISTAESLTIHDVVISQSGDAFTFGSGSNSDIKHQMTGNLYLTGSVGITVDSPTLQPVFIGTASWATQSVSASTALTASYILGTNVDGAVNAFPFTGSAQISGSLSITGSGLFISTSQNTIGVYATSSWASQSVSASTSLTASYITASNIDGIAEAFPYTGSAHITGSLSISASGLFVSTSQINTIGVYATSSWASQSVSASHAATASYIDLSDIEGTFDPFPYVGDPVITGSLELIDSSSTNRVNAAGDITITNGNKIITSSGTALFGNYRTLFEGEEDGDTNLFELFEASTTQELFIDLNIDSEVMNTSFDSGQPRTLTKVIYNALGRKSNGNVTDPTSYLLHPNLRISGSNNPTNLSSSWTSIAHDDTPTVINTAGAANGHLNGRTFSFFNTQSYSWYRFQFDGTQNDTAIVNLKYFSLFTEQGNVKANNFFGNLEGSSSWAHYSLISNNSISASNAINSISASYVGPNGIMSGSLFGTASWAYSASNAVSSSHAATASYIAVGNVDGLSTDEDGNVTSENATSAVYADFAGEATHSLSMSIHPTDTQDTEFNINTGAAGGVFVPQYDDLIVTTDLPSPHRLTLTDRVGYNGKHQIFAPTIEEFSYSAERNTFGFGLVDKTYQGANLSPSNNGFRLEKGPNIPTYKLEVNGVLRVHGANNDGIQYQTGSDDASKIKDVGIVLSQRGTRIVGEYQDPTFDVDSYYGYQSEVIDNDQFGNPIFGIAPQPSPKVATILKFNSGKQFIEIGDPDQSMTNGLNLYGGLSNTITGVGAPINLITEASVEQLDDDGVSIVNKPASALKVVASTNHPSEVRVRGAFAIGTTRHRQAVPESGIFYDNPNYGDSDSNVPFTVWNKKQVQQDILDSEYNLIQLPSGRFSIITFGSYKADLHLDDTKGMVFAHDASTSNYTPIQISTNRSYYDDGVFETQTSRFNLDNRTGNIYLPAGNWESTPNGSETLQTLGAGSQGSLLQNYTPSSFKLRISGVRVKSGSNIDLDLLSFPAGNFQYDKVPNSLGVYDSNIESSIGNDIDGYGRALLVDKGVSMFRGNTLVGSPYVEANIREQQIQEAYNFRNYGTPSTFLEALAANAYNFITGQFLTLDEYVDTTISQYGEKDLGFKYSTDESPEMREWYGKWIRPIHSTGKFHTDLLQEEASTDFAIPSNVNSSVNAGSNGSSIFGYADLSPNSLCIKPNGVKDQNASPLGTSRYEKVAPELDAKFTINAIEKNISQNSADGYNEAAERSENFGITSTPTSNQATQYPGRLALQVFGKSKLNGTVELNGDLLVGVGYDVTEQTSDRRLKSNIKSLSPVLDNIKQLNPVLFDWKHKVQPQIINNKVVPVEPKYDEIGFIAQEVKKIFPNLISQKEQEQIGVKDPLRMNYVKLTPILVKGMQEQQTLIEKLSARIDELEKKLNK